MRTGIRLAHRATAARGTERQSFSQDNDGIHMTHAHGLFVLALVFHDSWHHDSRCRSPGLPGIRRPSGRQRGGEAALIEASPQCRTMCLMPGCTPWPLLCASCCLVRVVRPYWGKLAHCLCVHTTLSFWLTCSASGLGCLRVFLTLCVVTPGNIAKWAPPGRRLCPGVVIVRRRRHNRRCGRCGQYPAQDRRHQRMVAPGHMHGREYCLNGAGPWHACATANWAGWPKRNWRIGEASHPGPLRFQHDQVGIPSGLPATVEAMCGLINPLHRAADTPGLSC